MRLNMLSDRVEVVSDLGEVFVTGTYESQFAPTPSKWTVWDSTHLQLVEFDELDEALEWKEAFH